MSSCCCCVSIEPIKPVLINIGEIGRLESVWWGASIISFPNKTHFRFIFIREKMFFSLSLVSKIRLKLKKRRMKPVFSKLHIRSFIGEDWRFTFYSPYSCILQC